MSFSDYLLPRQKIITIRYRDKYVDLVSDSDHYGTMMTNTAGDRIEFDFSQCRVIGTRDIPMTGAEMVVVNECPRDVMIPADVVLKAANDPRVRALLDGGLVE